MLTKTFFTMEQLRGRIIFALHLEEISIVYDYVLSLPNKIVSIIQNDDCFLSSLELHSGFSPGRLDFSPYRICLRMHEHHSVLLLPLCIIYYPYQGNYPVINLY